MSAWSAAISARFSKKILTVGASMMVMAIMTTSSASMRPEKALAGTGSRSSAGAAPSLDRLGRARLGGALLAGAWLCRLLAGPLLPERPTALRRSSGLRAVGPACAGVAGVLAGRPGRPGRHCRAWCVLGPAGTAEISLDDVAAVAGVRRLRGRRRGPGNLGSAGSHVTPVMPGSHRAGLRLAVQCCSVLIPWPGPGTDTEPAARRQRRMVPKRNRWPWSFNHSHRFAGSCGY